MHRHGRVRIDLSVPTEEADVHLRARVAADRDNRVLVMVVAVFHRLDQVRHQLTRNTGVLVLVATRPNGDIEAVEIRAVVYRDPVVGDVIEINDALFFRGARRARASGGWPEAPGPPIGFH